MFLNTVIAVVYIIKISTHLDQYSLIVSFFLKNVLNFFKKKAAGTDKGIRKSRKDINKDINVTTTSVTTTRS
jgi:hypothetical protein